MSEEKQREEREIERKTDGDILRQIMRAKEREIDR